LRLEAEAPSVLWSEASYRLRRNPTAILGGIFVSTFVVIAIFAPLIAPENPEAARPDRLHFGTPPGPSWDHWFGLDLQGRDDFSRIVYGARYSLLIGVVSVTIGLTIGLILGALAGFFGGYADSGIMRLMDIMLAIPGLLFAVGIVAMLGAGLRQVVIAGGVVNIAAFTRFLLGPILAQRDERCVL